MVSRLNSGLYFLRFMNTSLQLRVSLLESVPANGVEPQEASCVIKAIGQFSSF